MILVKKEIVLLLNLLVLQKGARYFGCFLLKFNFLLEFSFNPFEWCLFFAALIPNFRHKSFLLFSRVCNLRAFLALLDDWYSWPSITFILALCTLSSWDFWCRVILSARQALHILEWFLLVLCRCQLRFPC